MGSVQTDITNPYETISCKCIYCFVCIATRLEAEECEGWICLRCGELVKECKPWAGDVLEEVSRPGSGKSVSFSDEEERRDGHDGHVLREVDPRSEEEEEADEEKGSSPEIVDEKELGSSFSEGVSGEVNWGGERSDEAEVETETDLTEMSSPDVR